LDDIDVLSNLENKATKYCLTFRTPDQGAEECRISDWQYGRNVGLSSSSHDIADASFPLSEEILEQGLSTC